MHRISLLLVAAAESSSYDRPCWQRRSKAAASQEHRALLTHIAFQKLYLEPRTAATTGKGKSRKMDTIMADIKAAAFNTWAHRWFVHLSSPFGWILKYERLWSDRRKRCLKRGELKQNAEQILEKKTWQLKVSCTWIFCFPHKSSPSYQGWKVTY